jgi:hypothetical protein
MFRVNSTAREKVRSYSIGEEVDRVDTMGARQEMRNIRQEAEVGGRIEVRMGGGKPDYRWILERDGKGGGLAGLGEDSKVSMQRIMEACHQLTLTGGLPAFVRRVTSP